MINGSGFNNLYYYKVKPLSLKQLVQLLSKTLQDLQTILHFKQINFFNVLSIFEYVPS